MGTPSVGSLNDWVHLDAIQALIHHASAVIAAIFLFGITGRLIAYLIPNGHAKKIVLIIDDVILLAVFALAGWRLLVYMWVKPEFEENLAQRIHVAQSTSKTKADAIDTTLAQCEAAVKTGGQMQQCLQQKSEQADQALANASVRAKAAMGPPDQIGGTEIGAAKIFDQAQQAFVRYRQAECGWRSSMAGTENAANVYRACIADLTAWRAAQIDQQLRKP